MVPKAAPVPPIAPPLEDDDPRALLRAADAENPAKAKAPVPAKAKAKAKGAGKAKPKGKAAAPASSSGGPPPPPPKAVLPAPVAPPPKPMAVAFEFAMPGSSSGAAPPVGPPPKVARKKSEKRPFKPAIGDGEASFQEYVNPETGNLYSNWMFSCPHHPECFRTRGCHSANTAVHGYLEPVAFLHAWRDTPPGERGHRLTDPSPEAVAGFFNSHHAEIEALWSEFATP